MQRVLTRSHTQGVLVSPHMQGVLARIDDTGSCTWCPQTHHTGRLKQAVVCTCVSDPLLRASHWAAGSGPVGGPA